MSEDHTKIECPVCGKFWRKANISTHVNSCLNALNSVKTDKRNRSPVDKSDSLCQPAEKRPKTTESAKSAEAQRQSAGHDQQQLPVHQVDKKAAAWGCLGSPKSHAKNQVNQKKEQTVVKCTLSSSQNNTAPKSPITTTGTSQANISTTRSPHHVSQNGLQTAMSPTLKQPGFTLGQKQISSQGPDKGKSNVPLAEKMRPKSMQDYVGQEQVIGKNKLLRTLVESHHIPSMILWGPPGCGKVKKSLCIIKLQILKFIIRDCLEVITEVWSLVCGGGGTVRLFQSDDLRICTIQISSVPHFL